MYRKHSQRETDERRGNKARKDNKGGGGVSEQAAKVSYKQSQKIGEKK